MGSMLQNGINRFIDYFMKQLDQIQALQTENGELYRKLLYVSMLDTLACSAMPKRTSNGDRYVYFLKRFCRWPDGERISLPHLVQLLTKNPDPAYESLRVWANERFLALPVHGSALMPIAHDPSYDEVKKRWPPTKEHREPIDGVALEDLQHYRLLYAYRNGLVHELRVMGYGMEFGNGDTQPFYHLMSTLGDDDQFDRNSVELVYPSAFLHGLCKVALEQLSAYFTANNLNPFDSFVFGTYWLRELNA